ncbi:hypothetical protein ILUMI_06701 [Ignelater luminosus]|uniref:ARF7 effector protein C-terminal domain-containing protein n=1 Tax=Ignelater luminosus TaxID=2038154 RepID=A0A8K0DEZ3_IGNLU|nr:hypothetical protein ILUMI_06701 [Ignelater luminosus]
MPSLANSSKVDGRSDNLTMATEKMKISNVVEELIELDSDDNSEDITPKVIPTDTVKRIAKKSTATPELRQPPAASTRRQVALANSIKKASTSVDRFMENFDPESSARERRKLSRKVNAVATLTRKTPGAVYDENGIHILAGIDLCDCLQKQCPGCHFPCPKCRSTKCGPDCRCNRKYTYELLEYQGCDLVVRNPLNK